ncbi:Dihydrofolate synthase/folylpolyglutamate synthase [Candidatus Kinetoplastibacterium sorsogonicusi]|uniref:Dihydrofolate synthase/folylpolyglutamate synthase n=1 Tax=Candidatus Kinetoplastidibacterium kentomonadis TaxID=1576550 RepID=A0A3Q8F6I8_9PROT|nr:bifunctional tetrahydrofolate synthase/dihydrofolate synthase [Candidatus Kinetoplastibacterium sorsogonicusi]AWD32417.1 Dihydrofolate synthase/folylpolyglutamate synthase [Candidatus Kinetoplastibacterium sorsogonicusi]
MKKLNIKNSVKEWLFYIENIHNKNIDMDLSRINIVFSKLNLNFNNTIKFTVGGTNGKGSICATLESILIAAGYRVGKYTSPHLIKFNERIQIDGQLVDDNLLLEAFIKIEEVRSNISLTYFEFTTLVALYIFYIQKLDIIILEIGLGGRLDAVNIINTDCAIISNINLDHTEILGNNIESIGFEKANIFRANKPAICGDTNPPISLLNYAKKLSANLFILGIDFDYSINDNTWTYKGKNFILDYINFPKMHGNNQIINACNSLAALDMMSNVLKIEKNIINIGLQNAFIPGRFQIITIDKKTIILDVAHNGHAANILFENLNNMKSFYKKTYAVFGMLKDKDIDIVIDKFLNIIDIWNCTSLKHFRGLTSDEIYNKISDKISKNTNIYKFDNPQIAFMNAMQKSSEYDRIIVFGSFLTVSPILEKLQLI